MSTLHESDTHSEPVDRGAVIGDGIARLARWSLRLLLVAAGAFIVWWLLAKLWVGVFPVMLALIVATVLWPPTRWLRSKGVPAGARRGAGHPRGARRLLRGARRDHPVPGQPVG
ncbi:hypothetical protein LP422_12155 [Janibacter limosus]|uniref:Uncharacterized protein n=1 Tax=Janibacter limosus TaxID=53458 RepID=A0AC61U110_9MICO|nr:hypothetical protein [Janibacter limosus]UUZ43656.1 hypothetical protein LP422_12155 [Janibacter limosus]